MSNTRDPAATQAPGPAATQATTKATIDPAALMKRALRKLEETEARLRQSEERQREPIAIVGLSCRFPGGASSPEAFAALLMEGRDGVGTVPADRWDVDAFFDPDPDARGSIYTRWGCFIDEVDRFDAGLFGISPREAAFMDPQQRLLLEVSWEAIERAGMAPASLAGSNTGVFIGIASHDYFEMATASAEHIDPYTGSGTSHSVAAGRLAYVLGLQGPAMAVDTACSSSLVSVHLACQALRNRECDLALAGGVSLILTPILPVIESRTRMLAPDGRCKTFDAAANGVVRGEGCGVVMLKRLSDALRDGDDIRAVIRGSAVNQDGRSAGLTVPNGPAQEVVIRRALDMAGVTPAQVGYVETHGTGTSLGDPIEVEALGAVLGSQRQADAPLVIGSVKPNIGHLEAAAGIAGLIKVVLTFELDAIPPQAHFDTPNPAVNWDSLPVRIPRAPTPWPAMGGCRIAGTSSFGFSGTNVHVVLEAPPQPSPSGAEQAPPVEPPGHDAWRLVALSAATGEALDALVARYQTHLDAHPGLPLDAIAATANQGRNHHRHRLAVIARSTAELADTLRARTEARDATAAAGAGAATNARLDEVSGTRPGSVEGVAPDEAPRIAFLFSGQGAQYAGMGRDLYDTEPRFRASMDRCAEILAPHLARPLTSVLFADDGSLLAQTEYTQPALFALQYALAELWRSFGIVPDVVMGHSVGELAAACVAGVISLEDGLMLAAERGRRMQALREPGRMAAVFAGEERVLRALAAHGGDGEGHGASLSVAAVNGPRNVVIAGALAAVDRVLEALRAEGVDARVLDVSHAFHSPLMEPMMAGFAEVAGRVSYQRPRIGFVSCLTGKPVPDDPALEGGAGDWSQYWSGYWVTHARAPVRFADGLAALAYTGCSVLLELGPGSTLVDMAAGQWPHERVRLLPSLRRRVSGPRQIMDSLAGLYAGGASVRWAALDPAARDAGAGDRKAQPGQPQPPGRTTRPVLLPTYPFERQRHWLASPGPVFRASHGNGVTAHGAHPLLGRRIHAPTHGPGELHFEAHLGTSAPALLGQHRVFGRAIVPATAFIEMALAAGREALGHDQVCVEDLSIAQPLVLPEDGRVTTQVVVAPAEDDATARAGAPALAGAPTRVGVRSVRVYSLAADEADDAGGAGAAPAWRLHISAHIRDGRAGMPASASPAEEWAAQAGAHGPSAMNTPGEPRSVDAHYEKTLAYGLELGPLFRSVQSLWRTEHGGAARVALPAFAAESGSGARYLVHPALLDACLQALSVDFGDAVAGETYLPVGLARLTVHARPGAVAFCETRRVAQAHRSASASAGQPMGEKLVVDAVLLDEDGRVLVTVDALTLRRARRDALFAERAPHDWLYEIAWQPRLRPGTAAGFIPQPEALAAAIQPGLADIVSADEVAEYEGVLAGLEALSLDYIIAAFQRLEWTFTPGQRFATSDMAARLRVAGEHHRLLGRLLAILAEEGHLAHADGGWLVRSAPPPVTPDARHAALVARYPQARAELAMLARCGASLALVLRGQQNPLDLLFPGASLDQVAELYRNTPVIRLMNAVARQAVLGAIEAAPAGRPLRILEVGAGTGETTDYLLAHLPADRTEYVFTDVSKLFTAKAAERFAGFPFVRYEVLDVEQAPEAEAGYDLVLASNVVHTTRDARMVLDNLRRHLAPGGALVLLEGTVALRWVDLTFGLTEGWWRFADHHLRPDYPLLPPARWCEQLEACGFEQAAVISPRGDLPAVLGQQAVIVARTRNAPAADRASGHWLILADRGGAGAALADELRAQGGTCTVVHAPAVHEPVDLARVVAGMPTTRGVVHLWSLDSAPAESLLPEDLRRASALGCGSVLHLVQVLARLGVGAPPLTLVTRAAQPAAGLARLADDSLAGVAQSTLWGMARVIVREHPELGCRIIDLGSQDGDARALASEARELLDELVAGDGEHEVALRGQDRRVARLVRPDPLVARGPLPVRSDATYLITGGLGGLGLATARWLADRGARHLALLSRRPPGAEAAACVDALTRDGVAVLTLQADVARGEDVARALAELDARMPPLRGVVHSVGVLEDGILSGLSWERFAAVLAPKVEGAWHLHRLTRDRPLDLFVLYGSAVSFLGAWGQANHTAANTFLDALAYHRRSLGLPGTCIAWGAWEGVGAAAVRPEASERMRAMGMSTIAPEQGIAMLERLLAADVTQMGVVPIAWSKFLDKLGETRFFSAVLADGASGDAAEAGLLAQLEQAPARARRGLLEEHIRGQVAQVLGLGAVASVDTRARLFQLGVDSLMAVELKNRLSASLGRPLRATLVFDFPTIEAIAEHLGKEVLGLLPGTAASATAPAAPEGPLAAAGPASASVPGPTPDPAQQVLDVKQMSDSELEELIAREFHDLTRPGRP